ncbi:hypothetical protein [Lactobacillus corticis]|uniref:Uncharacterized protein n=1 Tax=Lactobacillus corticis TaxID=2201249 RepID=A0A916VGQ8_9LACO|nr:hypothetical protein [Lactobacillus corticis]GFZ26221.1 hypothetical protein LCB40_01010 [Lactobacillus corticis]
MTDYLQILDEIVDGTRKEFLIEPKDAYEFQRVLRDYDKRQDITGRALHGGKIIYHRKNASE